MTSHRGNGWRIVIGGMIIFLTPLFVIGATGGTVETTPASNTGSESVPAVTTPLPSDTIVPTESTSNNKPAEPVNTAASANLTCEQYKYWGLCKSKDKAGNPGGKYCDCYYKIPTNEKPQKGYCVFDADQKKGVCRAANVAQGDAPTPDSNAGGAPPIDPSEGGTSEPPIEPPPPIDNSGGSSSGGSSGGQTGSGSTGGTPPVPSIPGSGGANTGGTSNNTGGSAGGQIGDIANGGNPPPTDGFKNPSNFGQNSWNSGRPTWGSLTDYAKNLIGKQSNSVSSPSFNTINTTYQVNPQGNSAPGNTFGGGPSFYEPIDEYQNFYSILNHASDSIAQGIGNVFKSLTGIGTEPARYSPPNQVNVDLPSDEPDTGSGSSAINASSSQDQTPGPEDNLTPLDKKDLPPQVSKAVSQIRDGLEAINEQLNLGDAEGYKTPAKSSMSSFDDTQTGTTSPKATLRSEAAEKAVQALRTAEERMQRLEDELSKGKGELSKSNDKVQALTDQLNAMNRKIQEVNQALSNPDIPEEERNGLIEALATNIQLSLESVEADLEKAVSEKAPRTLGEAVAESLGGGASGILEITTKISEGISRLIQNFWLSIFG